MKKILFAAIAALLMAGCQQENPESINPVIKGFLVLNNGNWGGNDASVSLYNPDDKLVTGDVFFNANSQCLGDLGQDVVVSGSEIYIAVNGSKVVFVTDLELKIKKAIEADGTDGSKLSPRCFAVNGGKVYVTYQEGYLGEISSDYSVRTTAVGSYPEGICISNGKAYVANSGYGSGNTLSVVDLTAFKEIKKIEVNKNPQSIVADDSGMTLYVCSWDSYDPATYAVISPSKLQKINLADDSVTDLEYKDVKAIARGDENKLLVATAGYDENFQLVATVRQIDMASGTDTGKVIGDTFDNYYSLSFSCGHIFIGTSDYTTNGDVYVYESNGVFVDKFDSEGLNPQKVVSLK